MGKPVGNHTRWDTRREQFPSLASRSNVEYRRSRPTREGIIGMTALQLRAYEVDLPKLIRGRVGVCPVGALMVRLKEHTGDGAS